ncbi:PhoH family protein [Parapedobacter sp. ISTM3]|uniref:PhoH-like ATPase n=1 Tax=Parapedobacter luteus TaxID=623280 RepID=A0A1T5CYD9_9SPHI|nr:MULTISPECIES: PhoH family protein [Parapedobacter]MBK1440634.1 PhoH family protein [Parapedobacter sp. ISTM3]SKB64230.1 PhoH-like ATPase [Parapedobacter luteus]
MTASRKIFVLDTSVILYDHNALNNFQEHDVAVPIQVLEELDNMKGGNETRNFEARSFIRLIDGLSKKKLINQWVHLNGQSKGKFRVILSGKPQRNDAAEIFGNEKYDHQIINAALTLMEENPARKVVLVSKDICLRLKAKALNLPAEDYETGKIKNVDELYTGKTVRKDLTDELVEALKNRAPVAVDGTSFNHIGANQFYVLKRGRKTFNAFYHKSTQTLAPVSTAPVFRIKPRNPEQAFALHALLDPAIRLVSIQGNAGTGKTLLALASALEQRKNYRQIYITRPVIPLSNKEIGFLPGDAKSKTDPFLAPIWDNLRFIKEQYADDEKMLGKIDELIATEKIAITPLAFIRGRTLTKIFFIVDEAQNLTPHEIKTIISRAGEHTKIVFTGDIYQIDTPYLDAESNGLSYLIENVKNHPLYAHITLQKGERSELANLANDLL